MNITLGGFIALFALAPSSTNYNLKAFEFGTGGEDSLNSTNYSLNGLSGDLSAGSLSSTNYILGSGETPTQNTNITPPPTVTNSSNYYNRLRITIDNANNPSDTTYLIAVSDDNFATTYYVQTDNSIGPALTIANYQNYISWGGASGFIVLGLRPSTTYQVKVKALQGNFSESAYSQVGSASTTATSLSFSVATSLTATPPFNVTFTSLPANTVTDAAATANIAFSTNAINGGAVYVKSANSGLVSALASTTINSNTADLSIATSGYGALVSAVSQSSGGPFVAQTPYNGAGNNVGGLSTGLSTIITTASAISTANATVTLKAKSNATTPSSTDYSDIVTFVASAVF